jgi:uncharacterized protein YozE (UPF0346 family)
MTFYRWLRLNRHRSDPVADIANDLLTDPNWPKRTNSWVEVVEAFRAVVPNACSEARRALYIT